MAWWNRRREPAPQAASVQALTPGWNRTAKRLRQAWQERAEFFATNLGAIRFASGLKADSAARCTLRIEKNIDPRKDTWEPVEDSFLQDVLHVYKGRDQTQAELVRLHVWQYETIGEAYQLTERDGRHAFFSIRSPLSITWRSDIALVLDVPGGSLRDGTAREFPLEALRRLWIPHETYPGLAVSPLKGVLRDCERYWSLQRRMQLTADSALGMGSMFWTSEGMHTAADRGRTKPNDGQPGTLLERDYYALAQRRFEDADLLSVESIVPPMIRGPANEEPKIIDFANKFDDQAIAYRTEALECIGRGLNYPQRLLVDGGGGMNHWGAWLLEEQFVKNALAPTLERVCWMDISNSFLRPVLTSMAVQGKWEGNPADYRVGFDTAPVVVHPDQSKMAIELYKLGVLSDRELLEVSGFDATAAPNREELGRWIAKTQVMRERITAPNSPVLPSDAADVLAQTPAADPGAPVPVTAALDVGSRVRESVMVGPYPGEEIGWLT